MAVSLSGLTDSETAILGTVSKICAAEIAPAALEIDRSAKFPRRLHELLHQVGLLGLLVAEEHGGLGASVLFATYVYEEIAKASAAVATMIINSIEAMIPIVLYAEPDARDEVLARVLEDGQIPCFALTEPGAGSDATAIKTRADADGSDYLLSGRKVFCTNGAVGDVYIVFAVTDPAARKGARLSAFLVDRGTRGFETGHVEDTMGLRGSPLTELLFDEVRIPAGRRLGAEGQGLEVAMAMLNESRVGAAAQCVGIGQAALEQSVRYAAQREQSGRPIIEFQAMQVLLADMAISTEAARQLTRAAARAHDTADPAAIQLSAMCKSFASDAAVRIATDAIQIHGGAGYTREIGVERLLRDAKAYQIFDGTNQIQRITIAKHLRRAYSPPPPQARGR
jgi:alkylation response protein AidB-like acyl-CoA dehydrogenase